MMKYNTNRIRWFIIFCLCQIFAFGQEQIYKINLKSKNKLIGQIVNEDQSNLKLKIADSSYVTVNKSDIKNSIKLNVNKIQKGIYWDGNIHSQRYFFSGSAYTIDKGDIYYRNILGFYHGWEYGITNRLNISGGVNFYSILTNDDNARTYNMSIKYGGWQLTDNLISSISFNYSDVKYDFLQSFFESDKYLSLTGLFTYGNTDNNFTLGFGAFRFAGSHSFSAPSRPIGYIYKTNTFTTFRLNGSLRVSDKFALISENWIINHDEYSDFLSAGVRFLQYKFIAELAIIYKAGDKFSFFYKETYPYLNISYRF